MADVSIKGDAYVSVHNVDNTSPITGSEDNNTQRVRLHVTGKSGDTTVVATIRSNGATRGQVGSGDADDGHTDLQADQLYLTTKAGPLNIKAGDWWASHGLGVRSKDASKANALYVTTKVADWTVGAYTDQDSANHPTLVASGKAGPANIKFKHNPDGFTNVAATASFGNINVSAELHDTDELPGVADDDTTFIHIGGKVDNFSWDVAQIKNDQANGGNAKFAPLGSMLVGKSARGGTGTALGDSLDFTKITGIKLGVNAAGGNIAGIFTNLKDGSAKSKGAEVIYTRPLSGATLTANLGKLDPKVGDSTNVSGVRIDVSF